MKRHFTKIVFTVKADEPAMKIEIKAKADRKVRWRIHVFALKDRKFRKEYLGLEPFTLRRVSS